MESSSDLIFSPVMIILSRQTCKRPYEFYTMIILSDPYGITQEFIAASRKASLPAKITPCYSMCCVSTCSLTCHHHPVSDGRAIVLQLIPSEQHTSVLPEYPDPWGSGLEKVILNAHGL